MAIEAQEIQKNIQKIKNIMKILDFSNEEIEKQTKELGEVLLMAIWVRLTEGKDVQTIRGKPNQEELQKFIEDNYSKEEIQKIVQEESEKVIGGYLAEITKGVPQDKLDKIEVILAEK